MNATPTRPAATPSPTGRRQGATRRGARPAGDAARGAGTRQVINGTGVISHPHLGGAVLSGPARAAVIAASGCTDLEFDLVTRRRHRRGRPVVEALAAAVPAAEAAHLVNNHAAALILAVHALAADRDVVISAADLHARHDGYRLPELLTAAGARIQPVGTLDGAHVADYRRAVWAGTGCVLRFLDSGVRAGRAIHPDLDVLVPLGVPVLADIAAGLLLPEPALPGQPDVDTALRQGAAVAVTGAGLMVGGPAAGLVLGRWPVIDAMRRSALARAVQADKLTLAALEGTLGRPTPTLDAVRITVPLLRHRGEAVVRSLRSAGISAELVPSTATVDRSGRDVRLPSIAVAVDRALDDALRRGDPAVVARRVDHRLLVDLRSVPETLDRQLVRAVVVAAGGAPPAASPPDRRGVKRPFSRAKPGRRAQRERS